MSDLRTDRLAMPKARCPRPAVTGRDFALSPSNAHTPGP